MIPGLNKIYSKIAVSLWPCGVTVSLSVREGVTVALQTRRGKKKLSIVWVCCVQGCESVVWGRLHAAGQQDIRCVPV